VIRRVKSLRLYVLAFDTAPSQANTNGIMGTMYVKDRCFQVSCFTNGVINNAIKKRMGRVAH